MSGSTNSNIGVPPFLASSAGKRNVTNVALHSDREDPFLARVATHLSRWSLGPWGTALGCKNSHGQNQMYFHPP